MPRSPKVPVELWVVMRDGVVIHYPFRRESEAVLRAHPTLDTVVRYVLPPPRKGKGKKGRRA